MKALIFAAFLITCTTPAAADGLIDNANGYSFDAKGRLIQFSGLLIGTDGRIVRLLKQGDKPPKTLDFRLDAKGKTIIPGLIDRGARVMDVALESYVREANMLGRPIQPRERDEAFFKFQENYLSRGITSVTDLATSLIDWNVYRRAGDAKRLRIRILSYAAGIDPMTIIAGNQPTGWLYNGRLEMAGLTVVDQPPFDDARVRNLMSRGAMDGFQIAAEPIGEGALDHSLAAIEEVAETYHGDRRWRLQAQTPPADADRIAKSNIIAMPPVDQSLANLATSLAARTRDAAFAAFAEDRIGTLMPGAQADFLLFDRDVIALPPVQAAEAKLTEVWIGGVRVWVAP